MRLAFTLFLLTLAAGAAFGQALPICLGTGDVPLRQLLDAGLQRQLNSLIEENETFKTLVAQKRMAVGLVDLSDEECTKFARVNGNEMMYAASLPKIAVLLATMDCLEKGELTETAEIRNDMRIMISKSDNAAATRLIDLVGFEKIEEVLTSDEYALYDEELGGGLWVGKRYASEGATHRDPLKHLSHAATVTQVCRFYYLLAQGKLVSEERSKQMLATMENPELTHKFVNTLSMLAPNARLFRKSGTWKTYHSDSVLVWGKERKYILVGLVDSPEGESILRNLAARVDKVMVH